MFGVSFETNVAEKSLRREEKDSGVGGQVGAPRAVGDCLAYLGRKVLHGGLESTSSVMLGPVCLKWDRLDLVADFSVHSVTLGGQLVVVQAHVGPLFWNETVIFFFNVSQENASGKCW